MSALVADSLQDLEDDKIVWTSHAIWYTTAIACKTDVLLIKKTGDDIRFVLYHNDDLVETYVNHGLVDNLIRGKKTLERPDRHWFIGSFINSDLVLWLTTEWLNRPTLSIYSAHNEKNAIKFLIDPENRPYLNKAEKTHVLNEFIDFVAVNTAYVAGTETPDALHTFDQDDQNP